MRRTRRGCELAARAIAGVSALFWAVLFFGVIDLAVPIQETPGFYEAYLLETGWGVLYTFLVAGGFALLAIRPSSALPAIQLVLVAISLAVTAVAAESWIQLVPAAALGANCAAVVGLAGGRSGLRPDLARPRVDPAVGLVAAAALLSAALFAVDMVNGFREGRPPLDDDTWGIDHWPTQAAMALAIAAVAVAVAAGVRARWSGVAASGSCVAVSAAWFGYWSTAYPDHAGSAGGAWGTAAMVWALVFISVVGWRLVRRRPTAAIDTA